MSGGRRQSVVDRNSGSPRGLGDEAMICRHSGAGASSPAAEAEWTSPVDWIFPQQGWRLDEDRPEITKIFAHLLHIHGLFVVVRQQRGENPDF
jgi:hypothetical protein